MGVRKRYRQETGGKGLRIRGTAQWRLRKRSAVAIGVRDTRQNWPQEGQARPWRQMPLISGYFHLSLSKYIISVEIALCQCWLILEKQYLHCVLFSASISSDPIV